MHTKRSELCNYADISRARVFGCAPCATRPHAHVFLRRNRSDTSNPRARVFGLRTYGRASRAHVFVEGSVTLTLLFACARFWFRTVRSLCFRARTFCVQPVRTSAETPSFACACFCVRTVRMPHSRVRAFLHRNSSQRPVLGTRKRPLHAFHLEVVRPWGALRCSVYRLTLTRRLLPGRYRRCLGRGWR